MTFEVWGVRWCWASDLRGGQDALVLDAFGEQVVSGAVSEQSGGRCGVCGCGSGVEW
jgi:hypothetical protein